MPLRLFCSAPLIVKNCLLPDFGTASKNRQVPSFPQTLPGHRTCPTSTIRAVCQSARGFLRLIPGLDPKSAIRSAARMTLLFVFHDEQRVSSVTQTMQNLDYATDVPAVQSNGRFVPAQTKYSPEWFQAQSVRLIRCTSPPLKVRDCRSSAQVAQANPFQVTEPGSELHSTATMPPHRRVTAPGCERKTPRNV